MNSDFKEGLRKMGNFQVRYKSIKEHRLSALLVKRVGEEKVLVIMVTKLILWAPPIYPEIKCLE